MSISAVFRHWKAPKKPLRVDYYAEQLLWILSRTADTEESLIKRVGAQGEMWAMNKALVSLSQRGLIYSKVYCNGYDPKIPPWTMWYGTVEAYREATKLDKETRTALRRKHGNI